MKKLIQYTKIALLTIILAEEVRKAMKSEINLNVKINNLDEIEQLLNKSLSSNKNYVKDFIPNFVLD